MRDDFCAFILTHGRADNLLTPKTLRDCGYTGKVYFVVDDEDATIDEYRALYGDDVLVFSKSEVAREFDQGDNFSDRRTVFFARNACWRLANEVGCRFFIELDDDYYDFMYRLVGKRPADLEPQYHGWFIRSLDRVFEAMVGFIEETGAATLAMSQGGDHIGGADGSADIELWRKAMNSFVCDAQRPFTFLGRVNEDVSTYVAAGNTGALLFTYSALQLDQTDTQKAKGGMTEVYLDSGTYVKSFYTVMFAPSCVRVQWQPTMGRLHHRIAWNNAVPKLLHERHRKVAD